VTEAAADAEQREEILSLLAGRLGVDFRDYRAETLDRGLRGRLEALGLDSLQAYRRRLQDDPEEEDQLLRALVVPFTAFFRDPRVFEALEGAVLPRLYDLVAAADCAAGARPVRAWAIGVASGEEAWSLAMLLARTGGPGQPGRFEVVASDVDAASLAVGRAGRYPAAAASAVPPPLRERFLQAAGDEVTVSAELRPFVRFAEHDLVGRVLAPREAVVASFALVLVRNVLIYFDRRLQQKALERMAAVLEPGGALVLGDAETLPPTFADRFAPFPGVDRRLRIYQRTERNG
jgi:two-component system CheB/CheR fusion protein